MESTADLILFGAIAVTSLIGLAAVGQMDEEKAKREMARRRKVARRGATNFARIQALMALSSGVVKGVRK